MLRIPRYIPNPTQRCIKYLLCSRTRRVIQSCELKNLLTLDLPNMILIQAVRAAPGNFSLSSVQLQEQLESAITKALPKIWEVLDLESIFASFSFTKKQIKNCQQTPVPGRRDKKRKPGRRLAVKLWLCLDNQKTRLWALLCFSIELNFDL